MSNSISAPENARQKLVTSTNIAKMSPFDTAVEGNREGSRLLNGGSAT